MPLNSTNNFKVEKLAGKSAQISRKSYAKYASDVHRIFTDNGQVI